MSAVISFFDAFWSLMWFPLYHLDLGYVLVACPLLLIILTGFFGLLFNLVRRF